MWNVIKVAKWSKERALMSRKGTQVDVLLFRMLEECFYESQSDKDNETATDVEDILAYQLFRVILNDVYQTVGLNYLTTPTPREV